MDENGAVVAEKSDYRPWAFKSEILRFFAALRMTSVEGRIGMCRFVFGRVER